MRDPGDSTRTSLPVSADLGKREALFSSRTLAYTVDTVVGEQLPERALEGHLQ